MFNAILFFLFSFLYRRSSAIMSWSSTHVLFRTIGLPSVQGVTPTSIFLSAPAWTQTMTGSMQTTTANALTTSATPTPYLSVCHVHVKLCAIVLSYGIRILFLIKWDQNFIFVFLCLIYHHFDSTLEPLISRKKFFFISQKHVVQLCMCQPSWIY